MAHKLLEQIREHIDTVIKQETPIGLQLWQDFLKIHPVDRALFLSDLDSQDAQRLFVKLPQEPKLEVFEELSYSLKMLCLSAVDHHDRAFLLSHLPIDKLTDFLDELSDEELKDYLKLLTQKDRERVLSLMQFNPESAGGIMDTEVLTLMQDFTVEKSIQIMQRLQPDRELHRQIFVTDHRHHLTGSIYLEDLVLQHPKARLASFMEKSEFFVLDELDREAVAKMMVHYGLTMLPVVNKEGVFLGAIPSEILVEVLEQEASEDVYRMSALTPMKHSYLETPFIELVYQRGAILLGLILIQMVSSAIQQRYELLLAGIFIHLTMLTSAGGNASSQSSALAIQGMANGELHDANMTRFISREFRMSLILGLMLGFAQFIRLYFLHSNILACAAVSLSLVLIVIVSILFGSSLPWILNRFNIDPARSAGPLLATIMDVIGVVIFCMISQVVFG